MKKIVALATVLVLTLMVPVRGDDGVELLGYGQKTTATYHVDSEYVVNIPETVVCDGTKYYFTASTMDLCAGDIVYVTIKGLTDANGHFTLSTEDGREMQAQVFSNITSAPMANGDIAGVFMDGTCQTDGAIYILPDSERIRPGDYTGTIEFQIQLSH